MSVQDSQGADCRLFTCGGCSKPMHWIDGPLCDACHRKALDRQAAADASRAALAREREKTRAEAADAREKERILNRTTRVCVQCQKRFPTTYKQPNPVCPSCFQESIDAEKGLKEKTSKKHGKHAGRRHAN